MRLTEKDKQSFSYNIDYDISSDLTDGYDLKNGVSDICYTIGKLGQLEDIEEELGIDLITLFKALKNGAWTKFNNEISKCDECEYELLDIYIYFYWNNGKHLVFTLTEYGKTWALTKEELK